MQLEHSLESLKNLAQELEREYASISETISSSGKLPIDPSKPAFIRTEDMMDAGIDLMDLELTGEDADLRETIIALGQFDQEVDVAINKAT